MIQNGGQEVFVELKCIWKLLGHLNIKTYVCVNAFSLSHLPDTVNELQEDRAPLRVVVSVIPVTDSVAELVTETEPLLLYQNLG